MSEPLQHIWMKSARCCVVAPCSLYVLAATPSSSRCVSYLQDVYETHNLACLCTGAKEDPHFKTQGLRINGVKYTILRTMDSQTFAAKLEDGSSHNVTLEKVFIGKSKDSGLVVGVRGGYYFAAKYKSDPRADPSMAIAERLAIGFYWATGADA